MGGPGGTKGGSLWNSVRCSLSGLAWVLRHEKNARYHALASLGALGLSLFFRIDRVSFLFVVVAIVAVWISEVFNTTLEILADLVSPEYSEKVKQAKDIAAGGVLLASLGAVMIGFFVFGPGLLSLLAGGLGRE